MIEEYQGSTPPYFCWELPILTVSELNQKDKPQRKFKNGKSYFIPGWKVASLRHKTQKHVVKLKWSSENPEIVLPCIVKLTRLGARKLDDDNLRAAFKWIRDACAEMLIPGRAVGQADDDVRIQWEYAQEIKKPNGIRIEVKSYGIM